ncbi:MAG TPA: alpha/beta family hydrolase [Gemmatimonadales bacterium]|nr:alpha/beta family hydrolase [Gemmatimonadales bacterium]
MSRTTSMIPTQPVLVEADGVALPGDLSIPVETPGIVIFAHGSGSSRRSPRNRFVADILTEAGIGTLLFDLLTQEEEGDRRNVFDIPLLGRRLLAATRWLAGQPEAKGHAVGFFGASTGAAAALIAAATSDSPIGAVVSRGGRPDLAGEWLPKVKAPTLLIVGGRDFEVLDLNRSAYEKLTCLKRLEVVPGATHLFEERGALEAVAALAASWFRRYLVVRKPGEAL